MFRILMTLFLLMSSFGFSQPLFAGEKRKVSGIRYVELAGKRIVLAPGLGKNEADLLEADLNAIRDFQIRDADPELLKVMELRAADPEQLSRWLADRMGYVVPEDMDLNVSYGTAEILYPLPEVEVNLETIWFPYSGTRFGATVMSNESADIYSKGKARKRLASALIPGVGSVPIHSPRMGIFRVGTGFFEGLRTTNDGSVEFKRDSSFERIFRLSTLFHEARHGDGQGANLGFPHSICPIGHTFELRYACDRNLNGPYTVDALLMGELLMNCRNCSPREREALSLAASDAWDRVLTETAPLKAAPVRQAEIRKQSKKCFGSKTSAACEPGVIGDWVRELNERDPRGPKEKSVYWDSTPESL